jgi:hypothetical protein
MNIKNKDDLDNIIKNENLKNENNLIELRSEELRLVAGGDCLVDPGAPCGYVSRKWWD